MFTCVNNSVPDPAGERFYQCSKSPLNQHNCNKIQRVEDIPKGPYHQDDTTRQQPTEDNQLSTTNRVPLTPILQRDATTIMLPAEEIPTAGH